MKMKLLTRIYFEDHETISGFIAIFEMIKE